MDILLNKEAMVVAGVTNGDAAIYLCSSPRICGVCQLPRSAFVNRAGGTSCYDCDRRRDAEETAGVPQAKAVAGETPILARQ